MEFYNNSDVKVNEENDKRHTFIFNSLSKSTSPVRLIFVCVHTIYL